MRENYVYDKRVDYKPKKVPKYRYKNVEISFDIDFYIDNAFFDRYADYMISIIGDIGELISSIFISETNFIKFPEDFINGYPEGWSETKYPEGDKNAYIGIEYSDYGTDIHSVNIVKAFSHTFIIPYEIFMKGVYYYLYVEANLRITERIRNDFKDFRDYVRRQISAIVNKELTGVPGRKKSKGE